VAGAAELARQARSRGRQFPDRQTIVMTLSTNSMAFSREMRHRERIEFDLVRSLFSLDPRIGPPGLPRSSADI